MENKNTLIALVLMLAVWIGFTVLFPSAPPAPSQKGQPLSTSTDAAINTPLPTVPKPAVVPPPAAPVREQEIVVENDVFRAVLTNMGGRLKAMELKAYGTTPGEGAKPISLVTPGPGDLSTLRTTGVDGFSVPYDALYAVSGDLSSVRLGAGETREVVFSHRLPSGVLIEKVYSFRGDRHYDFNLRVRVINGGESSQRGNITLSLVHLWDESQKGGQFEHVGPVTFAGDKLDAADVEDLIEKPQVFGKEAAWTAFTDKYFLTAAVPLSGAAEKIRIEKTPSTVDNLLDSPPLALAPGEAATLEYFLYFGPKDLDLLKSVDYQLAEVVDFGFFAPIARPLLVVLKFFYGFLGNYGLSIILLTGIIKLIFWPLTQKSYSSMKAMQKLQPEMQKIREKYGKDRDRLNKELMGLYKTHRVNPLGGCLPMLVQIPVFFALYKVLMDAIELRHAPFFFWITDLSAKDPYYITPLIMGATMFIQQKMTPTTMDPMQAKVFMLMPVIFTFMFLNFPSGLVIYWLVNNLLTIGQQAWINRKA